MDLTFEEIKILDIASVAVERTMEAKSRVGLTHQFYISASHIILVFNILNQRWKNDRME